MDFLLMLIELFSLGIRPTAEALYGEYRFKIGDFASTGAG